MEIPTLMIFSILNIRKMSTDIRIQVLRIGFSHRISAPDSSIIKKYFRKDPLVWKKYRFLSI